MRAPRRWFRCIDYACGLKIETCYDSDASAFEAALDHLRQSAPGKVKIGYYGFRSRVIVCTDGEIRQAIG